METLSSTITILRWRLLIVSHRAPKAFDRHDYNGVQLIHTFTCIIKVLHCRRKIRSLARAGCAGYSL
jgi:hypothetical protein